MTLQRGPLLGFTDNRTAAREMRRLREAAGLLSYELAERLGQRPPWVCAREKGTIRLSAAEVPLIEKALGVAPGTLLGGQP